MNGDGWALRGEFAAVYGPINLAQADRLIVERGLTWNVLAAMSVGMINQADYARRVLRNQARVAEGEAAA